MRVNRMKLEKGKIYKHVGRIIPPSFTFFEVLDVRETYEGTLYKIACLLVVYRDGIVRNNWKGIEILHKHIDIGKVMESNIGEVVLARLKGVKE